MFLTTEDSGYDRDDQQFTKGKFLIAASSEKNKIPLGDGRSVERVYVCIRTVTMRPCGNWMMGHARIGDQTITLSGAYGSDGLTEDYDDLSPKAKAKFTALNDEESKAFWLGEGGWNSAGSEGDMMREIGLRLLKQQEPQVCKDCGSEIPKQLLGGRPDLCFDCYEIASNYGGW